jgi:hypothetical protein
MGWRRGLSRFHRFWQQQSAPTGREIRRRTARSSGWPHSANLGSPAVGACGGQIAFRAKRGSLFFLPRDDGRVADLELRRRLHQQRWIERDQLAAGWRRQIIAVCGLGGVRLLHEDLELLFLLAGSR